MKPTYSWLSQEAIKKLVSKCTFDCDDSGIALQAVDNSHVAFVSMMLCSDGFDPYRCDRNMPLGINVGLNSDKISECDFKLLDIDSEHLGIPDPTYDAVVLMSSVRFQETVRYLQQISDSGTTLAVIECTKEGTKFSCEGEAGKGGITLKAGDSVDSCGHDLLHQVSR
ncbi:hypothetical protein [Absidia glauca]|uniref:DNA sliding clamp PCNA n=1 Tax=Absidia glauca TaxID=4829 RepID=A0A163KSM6_ABSGL|nr:hypothetical protein [Absidia glauca]